MLSVAWDRADRAGASGRGGGRRVGGGGERAGVRWCCRGRGRRWSRWPRRRRRRGCGCGGCRWTTPRTRRRSTRSQAELAEALAGVSPRPGQVPFYSAVTGGLADTAGLDAAYWYANVREPVRFADVIEGAGRGRAHGVHRGVARIRCWWRRSPRRWRRPGAATPVVAGSLRRDEGGLDRLLASAARGVHPGCRGGLGGGVRRRPAPVGGPADVRVPAAAVLAAPGARRLGRAPAAADRRWRRGGVLGGGGAGGCGRAGRGGGRR